MREAVTGEAVTGEANMSKATIGEVTLDKKVSDEIKSDEIRMNETRSDSTTPDETIIKNDLRDICGGWSLIEKIGMGAAARVYRVKKEDQTQFEAALKVVLFVDEKNTKRGMDEYDIACEIGKNKNTIRYISRFKVVHENDLYIYIFTELLLPLSKYIEKNGLSLSDVVNIGMDICKALSVFKSHGIVHGDVKVENIFVTNDRTYKLGDFGSSVYFGKESDTLHATPSYMAPEVYKTGKYSLTCDIYSLGIVMYRLLGGASLSYGTSNLKTMPDDAAFGVDFGIKNGGFKKPGQCPEALFEVILKACDFCEKNRYADPLDMYNDLESSRTALKDDFEKKELENGFEFTKEDLDQTLSLGKDYRNDVTLPYKDLNFKSYKISSMKYFKEVHTDLTKHDVYPAKLDTNAIAMNDNAPSLNSAFCNENKSSKKHRKGKNKLAPELIVVCGVILLCFVAKMSNPISENKSTAIRNAAKENTLDEYRFLSYPSIVENLPECTLPDVGENVYSLEKKDESSSISTENTEQSTEATGSANESDKSVNESDKKSKKTLSGTSGKNSKKSSSDSLKQSKKASSGSLEQSDTNKNSSGKLGGKSDKNQSYNESKKSETTKNTTEKDTKSQENHTSSNSASSDKKTSKSGKDDGDDWEWIN